MSQRERLLLWPLAVALLLATGYAAYQVQAQRAATLARITALETCLVASSQQREQVAGMTMNGIKRVVCLVNNSPPDLQVLHHAERIQARTQALVDTLHTLRAQVQTTCITATQNAHLHSPA